MDEENFNMPSHSGLQTKTLKIQAYHIVREAAVKSFKDLNDEEKRLRKLMGNTNDNWGSVNLQESYDINQYQSIYPGVGTINFTPSQAEHTLSRYTSNVGHDT